jgi:hypothetical protein
MNFIPPDSQEPATSADTISDVDLISLNEPVVRDQSDIRLVCKPSPERPCNSCPNESQQHTNVLSFLQTTNNPSVNRQARNLILDMTENIKTQSS